MIAGVRANQLPGVVQRLNSRGAEILVATVLVGGHDEEQPGDVELIQHGHRVAELARQRVVE